MFRTISLAALFVIAALVSGCASVPMANSERDTQAKTFAGPAAGKANVYVYRNEAIGSLVKMDLVLNGKPIGQTTGMTFVVLEVPPGKHNLVSKSENESRIELVTEAGKNYFVWQEVKMGVLYARNLLQLVDEKTGKAGVAECSLIDAK
jgi:hypothetical protein